MQIDYRGLSLAETPVGDAAIAVKNNFMTLADRTGPMTISSTDPPTYDPATQIWSKWYNATTGQVFTCVDVTSGAATWKSYNDLSNDTTPTLSGNLIAGENTINVRSISSDTATVITAKNMRFKTTGAVDFNQNDITNFGSLLHFNAVGANNTITSDTGSLSFSATSIKLGGMHSPWPNSIGADSTYLCHNEGANIAFTTTARACSAGTVCMWPTMTPPTGWVLCDGSSYDGSNQTYVYLYHQIGHLYGGTAPTFNVPDYRGRTLFGMDGTAEFSYLGTTGGAKTVTLDSRHTPPHSHYTYQYVSNTGRPGNWVGTTNACTASTQVAGVGTAHNNLNPYRVVCWIIKL